MAEHSILPPSSAHIWGSTHGCRGWVMMSQMYPQADDTGSADRGEAGHQLGAKLIKRAIQNAGEPEPEWIGATTDNGVVIDAELLEAARLYASDVIPLMQEPDASFAVEDRVSIPRIHKQCFGTPDAWCYVPSRNRLTIWDAKFGHVPVDAVENWQMLCYAAGLIDALDLAGVLDQGLTIEFRIVQPFCYDGNGPIKTWQITGGEARGYFNVLEAGATDAMRPDAELRTGSHCRYCQARHACVPALQAGLTLWEHSAGLTVHDMSDDALGLQLVILTRAEEQIKSLRTAYEEQVTARLRSGHGVPGWDIEPAKGRKKWNRPVSEVIEMGDMFDVDLRKNDAITPNQAIKAGIDQAVVNSYSTVPTNGLKLVQADSTKASRIFGKE